MSTSIRPDTIIDAAKSMLKLPYRRRLQQQQQCNHSINNHHRLESSN
jgi:hypothetical protein